jgi:nanoRNase/pAp phosphatase (c-di-AMP/oligoRNAs hydrolase)
MICIYHSRDFDGWCSAAIISSKYPEAKLVGYDYGEPYPQVPDGVPLIIVDVSFPMEHMKNLANTRNNELMWIDHHISAIKEYKKFIKEKEDFCISYIKEDLAACELSWEAFYRDVEIPKAVRLLGTYDTYRNYGSEEWENETLPFQYGMRSLISSPEEFDMRLLENSKTSEDIIKEITEQGKTILRYVRKTEDDICARKSFEAEFDGFKAICLNKSSFNSLTFRKRYDSSKHDIMIGFHHNGKYWSVTIYTTHEHINCTEIAAKFGGGGHRKASGFSVDNILSLLKR